MAKTYNQNKRYIEPLYQRHRGVYQGPRESQKENLEMNQFLTDTLRIENQLLKINSLIIDNVRIFIGALDVEFSEIHTEYEDGKKYIFDDVDIFYENFSITEDNLEIDTLPTIDSKLHRLTQKIKILEQKKVVS